MMDKRRKQADERLAALRKANASLEDDDDGILERIFNSLTGGLLAMSTRTDNIIMFHTECEHYVCMCVLSIVPRGGGRIPACVCVCVCVCVLWMCCQDPTVELIALASEVVVLVSDPL